MRRRPPVANLTDMLALDDALPISIRAMNILYDGFRVAVHSVWTRRWLVLAVAWGICILGWLAIASIPNRYDSRARLLVNFNQILPDDAGGGRDRKSTRLNPRH